MTRAKDISKIVTDANLSGTLDVTGTMTAGGLTIGSPAFPTGVLKVKQDADNTRARGILLEANADDSLLAIGYNNGKFHLSTSYYTGGSFQPISVFTSNLERLNIASNGDISFYEDTGTTPKLFWDASAESLGIGTSSPAYKIDVNEIGHNSTGELLLTGGNASNDDYTQTTLLRLRATSINANVPSHADSSSVAEIRLNHANESGSNSSGYITFLTTGSNYNTNPAERMRIDSSGNVGIGTTTAAGGNGKGVAIYQSDYPRLSFRNSSTGDGSSDGVQMYMVSNDYYQFNNEIGSQIFGTSGTERMRINSSGDLLVGKTSADSGVVGFEARSTGETFTTSSGASLYAKRTTGDGDIVVLQGSSGTVGSIGTLSSYLNIGTGAVGLMFVSGDDTIRPHNIATNSARDDAIDLGEATVRFDDIRATNGTIQTSDQQEKNTITDSDLGIDFIKRLTPKSYIFNGKTRTHYGLIAQDVETVLSDISKPTSGFAGFIKDDISEEQDGSEYRYGLRYTEFVAPLIQAVKDQQATIDALTARITALENGE